MTLALEIKSRFDTVDPPVPDRVSTEIDFRLSTVVRPARQKNNKPQAPAWGTPDV
jgi:hypothetical protein